MKTVELAEATGSLSQYAQKAQKETLIVTQRGKPIAALMAVDAHTDLENLVVTTHPTFKAIMKRSEARYRAEGGISLETMRRKYGLKPARRGPRRAR